MSLHVPAQPVPWALLPTGYCCPYTAVNLAATCAHSLADTFLINRLIPFCFLGQITTKELPLCFHASHLKIWHTVFFLLAAVSWVGWVSVVDEQKTFAEGEQLPSAKAALLIIMEFFLDPLMISPRFPKSTWDSGDENTALAQFWLVHGKITTTAIRIIFISRNPLSKALPYKTDCPGQSPAAALVSVQAQRNGLCKYSRAAWAGLLRLEGDYHCCSELSLSVQPKCYLCCNNALRFPKTFRTSLCYIFLTGDHQWPISCHNKDKCLILWIVQLMKLRS